MIEIPAEPADPALLPPLLQGFGAVPPLVTDINLSLDDRFLYVSCWGTGEFRQYDVSDPFNPKLTGSVHLGGIVRKAAHPRERPLNGGPQMVEISRDGRRVYLTNSLYARVGRRSSTRTASAAGPSSWTSSRAAGCSSTRTSSWTSGPSGRTRSGSQGGDASSDSYCYPD